MVTRRESLKLLGTVLLLSNCSARDSNQVRVGCLNAKDNEAIAEIYAQALRRAGIAVHRQTVFGTQGLLFELKRGDIDIYPGCVCTRNAHSPSQMSLAMGGADLNAEAKKHYERRYGITWLAPSPMNASASLATTGFIAEKYWLITLTKCAKLASQLRLAASPDFLARGGMLDRMRELYGGFEFKAIAAVDHDAQYDLLGRTLRILNASRRILREAYELHLNRVLVDG
jgi:osmoprotectant transport system substrate-binding protein